MSLQSEIDTARAEIRTDGYPVSIGEWISIYEKRELDIHPEFQRFFRWRPHQKSRLIESILLGIPVPQVFVAQRADGVWDVVDGLQRLSTIFEFVGVLRGEDEEMVPPLTLEATKYLPSLAGLRWQDDAAPDKSLTQAQRLLIKRAKIDVSIILRESDEKTRFELFQRLNTGGSQLSDQELRNSIILMLNREFYRWLKELSEFSPFQEAIALSDRAREEQYDMELALRFIVFRTLPEERLRAVGDVAEFLTDRATELARDRAFDRDSERAAFERTFSVLADAMASDPFRRYDPLRGVHSGGFSVSAFETVALGLGYNARVFRGDSERVRGIVRGVWTDRTFTQNSGSGFRASQRVPHLVPLGRRAFAQ